MSRELFKETFFPLGIDDLSVYNWFLNGNRQWRVFKEGSENVSSLSMIHIATTRGKDELLYFNPMGENNKYIFNNIDIMFYDKDVKYAVDTDEDYSVYDTDGDDDDVLISGYGFSWNSEHTHDTSYTPPTVTVNGVDTVVDRRVFSSGLEVFCTAPDEYLDNPKYQEHLDTMLDIHELYYTKNKDYGDAFTKSLDKYGPIAAIVRMDDKWNRLENLVTEAKDGLIKDEPVEDTLIDLANYAIMTALYLRGKRTDD